MVEDLKDLRDEVRGVAATLLSFGAVVTLPVMAWIFWLATNAGGLHDVIGFDHALTARNVVEGQGMTSPVLSPLYLSIDRDLDNAAPIFARPVFVLWMALVFLVGGASGQAAVVASGIPWIITAWLVFMIARQLYGRGTAWMSFLVYLTNIQTLQISASGRPETLGMMLVCCLLLLLMRVDREADEQVMFDNPVTPPWRMCRIAGIVAGLLWLCVPYTGPSAWLILAIYWFYWPIRNDIENRLDVPNPPGNPFLAIRAWIKRSMGLRMLAQYTVAFLAPFVLLALVRLLIPGKSPESLFKYLSLVDTRVAPGWSYWRTSFTYDPSLPLGIMAHPDVMLAKVLDGIAFGCRGFVSIVHPAILILCAATLMFPLKAGKRGLLWILAVLVAMQIVVMSFYYWDASALTVWIPLLIVVSIGSFEGICLQRFIDRARTEAFVSPFQQIRREVVSYYLPLVALLFVCAWPFLRPDRNAERPRRLEPSNLVQELMKREEPFDVIATPAPWMISWFTGSTTIWLPETLRGMELLEERLGTNIQAVCFPRVRASILHDRVPAWWLLAMQRERFLDVYGNKETTVWGEVMYSRLPSGAGP